MPIPQSLHNAPLTPALFEANPSIFELIKEHNRYVSTTFNELSVENFNIFEQMLKASDSFYQENIISTLEDCLRIQAEFIDIGQSISRADELFRKKNSWRANIDHPTSLVCFLSATMLFPLIAIVADILVPVAPALAIGFAIAAVLTLVTGLIIGVCFALNRQMQAKKQYEQLFSMAIANDIETPLKAIQDGMPLLKTENNNRYTFFENKKAKLANEIATMSLFYP